MIWLVVIGFAAAAAVLAVLAVLGVCKVLGEISREEEARDRIFGLDEIDWDWPERPVERSAGTTRDGLDGLSARRQRPAEPEETA